MPRTPSRSFPGARPEPPAPGSPDDRGALPAPRLWRSRSNRVVAGVLGGVAEKFGLEPLPVRLLYGVFTIGSLGALAVPYLSLWWIAPAHGPARSTPRLWRSRSHKVVAGVLGGVAERLGVRPLFVRAPFVALTVATAVVPGLVAYLVAWAVTRPMDAPGRAPFGARPLRGRADR